MLLYVITEFNLQMIHHREYPEGHLQPVCRPENQRWTAVVPDQERPAGLGHQLVQLLGKFLLNTVYILSRKMDGPW